MIAFEGDIFCPKLKGFTLEYNLSIKLCGKHVLLSRAEEQNQRNDSLAILDRNMPISKTKPKTYHACEVVTFSTYETGTINCLTWSGRLFISFLLSPNK